MKQTQRKVQRETEPGLKLSRAPSDLATLAGQSC